VTSLNSACDSGKRFSLKSRTCLQIRELWPKICYFACGYLVHVQDTKYPGFGFVRFLVEKSTVSVLVFKTNPSLIMCLRIN